MNITPNRHTNMALRTSPAPQQDYLDAAARTCAQIHAHEPEGAVLVFLPGQEDIETVQGLLEGILPVASQQAKGSDEEDSDEDEDEGEGSKKKARPVQKELSVALTPEARISILKKREKVASQAVKDGKDHKGSNTSSSVFDQLEGEEVVAQFDDFCICPLYASLPPSQQMEAFKAPSTGVRKFVLSTNMAETSVTIADIKYVVDCGMHKTKEADATTGVEALKLAPVSKVGVFIHICVSLL